jgi:hypothetical protein
MGAVKRFAEEVSVALGFKGLINDRVLTVTYEVMSRVKTSGIPRERWVAEDTCFKDLVNEIDHEIFDIEHKKGDCLWTGEHNFKLGDT